MGQGQGVAGMYPLLIRTPQQQEAPMARTRGQGGVDAVEAGQRLPRLKRGGDPFRGTGLQATRPSQGHQQHGGRFEWHQGGHGPGGGHPPVPGLAEVGRRKGWPSGGRFPPSNRLPLSRFLR